MTANEFFPATGMPDDDWWTALWPHPDSVLRELGVGPGETVLDLCCGNGHFTVSLCHLVGRQGRVIGLDMDPQLLAAAKRRMMTEGPAFSKTTCSWIEGDACRVDDCLSAKVDVVLIANTFHGVPDKPGLARAVRRSLKPRGRFVVVNWHALNREDTPVLGQPRGPKTEMRMTPGQVVDCVVPAGFELRTVTELPPYHYAAVFQLAQNGREG